MLSADVGPIVRVCDFHLKAEMCFRAQASIAWGFFARLRMCQNLFRDYIGPAIVSESSLTCRPNMRMWKGLSTERR